MFRVWSGSAWPVRPGPADQAVGVFQGIAQAVVETLAVELSLADIVAPAQVGAADSRVQGFQGAQSSPGLGRPLRLFPGPGQDEGVGGAFCCSPGFLGRIADPPLGEHLQRVGLEPAGVLEDGLDSVCSGRHVVILLVSASLLPESPKPGCSPVNGPEVFGA